MDCAAHDFKAVAEIPRRRPPNGDNMRGFIKLAFAVGLIAGAYLALSNAAAPIVDALRGVIESLISGLTGQQCVKVTVPVVEEGTVVYEERVVCGPLAAPLREAEERGSVKCITILKPVVENGVVVRYEEVRVCNPSS